MTTPVLATVTLTASSGNPADNANNDFAFSMATFTSTDADNIATALASFYNTVQVIPGTDRAVAEFIGGQISRAANATTIDLYDLTGHLDGSPHGSPLYTRSFTLGSEANSELPSEVAACLSFHSDLSGLLEHSGSTRPAARRRGRVYIGPLNDLGNTNATSQPMLNDSIRDCLSAAAITLAGAVSAGWRVWSRAGSALYGPIVGGWIDNAYDTQRRRGPEFTARTLYVV